MNFFFYVPFEMIPTQFYDYETMRIMYTYPNFVSSDFVMDNYRGSFQKNEYLQEIQKNCNSTQQPFERKDKLLEQERKELNTKIQKKQIKQKFLNRPTIAPTNEALFQQKQNRNVFSNILRHFFKTLKETGDYTELIQKIIEKYQLSITRNKFIRWIDSSNVNFQKYIRLRRIRCLIENQRKPQCSLILRITLRHFLSSDVLAHIITSRRITKNSQKVHLKQVRTLFSKMFSFS